MLRQLTRRQLLEWRAYADLEPFDEQRADLRSAQIVAAIINKGRRRGFVTVKDCLLPFSRPAPAAKARTPEQAREQFKRAMNLIVAMHNEPRKRPSKPQERR